MKPHSMKLFDYAYLGSMFLGLLQFVTTFAITMFYVSFANNKLDPPAAAIRERLEQESEGANR